MIVRIGTLIRPGELTIGVRAGVSHLIFQRQELRVGAGIAENLGPLWGRFESDRAKYHHKRIVARSSANIVRLIEIVVAEVGYVCLRLVYVWSGVAAAHGPKVVFSHD